MRLPILIAYLCVLNATVVIAAGPVSKRMTERFKEEFRFEPAEIREDPDATPDPADPDTVVLPTLFVRPWALGIDKAVEESERRIERENFSWKHGGTIYRFGGPRGSLELKFKYNPEHNGIDLLNFSW